MKVNGRGAAVMAWVLFGVAALGVVACEGTKGGMSSKGVDTSGSADPKDVAAATADAPPSQAVGIGDGEAPVCSFNVTAADKCIGYSNLDFKAAGNSDALGRFVKSLSDDSKWNPPKLDNVRRTLNPARPARVDIRVIKDSKSVQFKDLKAGAVVMARMDVRGQMPATDARYGIDQTAIAAMGNKFYLVVEGFQPSTDVVNGGLAFGTWRIYGVTRGLNPKLLRVGSMEGKYRFCTTSHDDGEKLDGARFQPCTGARVGSETAKIPIIKDALKANESLISAMRRVNGSEKRLDQFTEQDVEKSLRKIVGNKVSTTAFSEAVSSDVIKSITRLLQDGPGDPAWMVCGIGCCTADGT